MLNVGLVFYIVSMFGLAYIVGHSAITKRLREWIVGDLSVAEWNHILFRRPLVDLLECPACFGFWSGIAMALIGSVPFEVQFNVIAWGLFTAGSNFIIAELTKLVD